MSNRVLKFILIVVVVLCSHHCVNASKTFNNNRLAMVARGAPLPSDAPQAVDSMIPIEQNWSDLSDFGELLTKYCNLSLLARAVLAGWFVGIGGILTASVGFDMGGAPWLAGNGFNRFLSGAVGFPLTIMLVAMTGVGAWTGDIVFVTKAYFDKKTSLASVARFFILSWLGCFAGTIAAAALATGAALPACGPCIDISVHKLAYSFSQVFFRGVGGGCLISLAIFMSKLNRDMVGKVLSIWFPISTYVIVDFEHVLASMFFMVCGKFNGADYSWKDLLAYLVPATLGNFVGGALLIGGVLSSIPKNVLSAISH